MVTPLGGAGWGRKGSSRPSPVSAYHLLRVVGYFCEGHGGGEVKMRYPEIPGENFVVRKRKSPRLGHTLITHRLRIHCFIDNTFRSRTPGHPLMDPTSSHGLTLETLETLRIDALIRACDLHWLTISLTNGSIAPKRILQMIYLEPRFNRFETPASAPIADYQSRIMTPNEHAMSESFLPWFKIQTYLWNLGC